MRLALIPRPGIRAYPAKLSRPTLASIIDRINKAHGLNLDDMHKIALEACISDLDGLRAPSRERLSRR